MSRVVRISPWRFLEELLASRAESVEGGGLVVLLPGLLEGRALTESRIPLRGRQI